MCFDACKPFDSEISPQTGEKVTPLGTFSGIFQDFAISGEMKVLFHCVPVPSRSDGPLPDLGDQEICPFREGCRHVRHQIRPICHSQRAMAEFGVELIRKISISRSGRAKCYVFDAMILATEPFAAPNGGSDTPKAMSRDENLLLAVPHPRHRVKKLLTNLFGVRFEAKMYFAALESGYAVRFSVRNPVHNGIGAAKDHNDQVMVANYGSLTLILVKELDVRVKIDRS